MKIVFWGPPHLRYYSKSFSCLLSGDTVELLHSFSVTLLLTSTQREIYRPTPAISRKSSRHHSDILHHPEKRQYLRLLSTFLHCVQKGSELSIKGLKEHQTKNYWTLSSHTSGPDGKEFATSTKQPSIWSIRSQNKKVILLLLEWKNVSCWSKHWNHEVKTKQIKMSSSDTEDRFPLKNHHRLISTTWEATIWPTFLRWIYSVMCFSFPASLFPQHWDLFQTYGSVYNHINVVRRDRFINLVD